LKAKGYFKTPQKIVEKMVATLFEAHPPSPSDRILDTGCGPGDFINGIVQWCNNNKVALQKITGVELDTSHAQNAQRRFKEHPQITIEKTDFLLKPEEKYDYIIGNPPYVPITELTAEEKKLYKPRFETAIERFDLYHLFFEKSLKSLEKGGRLVYITPEKFTYTSTTKPLRRLLASMQVKEIEFLDEDTFKGLTAYPTITVIDNMPYLEDTKVTYRDGTVKKVKLPITGESWASVLNGKMEADVKYRLKDVCKRISAGIATGADEVFVKKGNTIHEELKPHAYPTISGKELDSDKESFTVSNSMLVPYDKDGKLLPFEELGALAKYLSQDHIVKRLKKRVFSKGKAWYSFHDSVPMRDLLQPKIIFKDITVKPRFWIDEAGIIVPMHTVYYIVPKGGIRIEDIFNYLMSDFAQDWMMIHCQRARGGFIRLQSNVLKEMPIPEGLYSSHGNNEAMVSELEPNIFSEAVRFYWDQRNSQKRKQSQAGTTDQGTRSDVTGGSK
jgi:cyclopropane fatty-acyl-phospholipid synthase-like methyltransferase